MLESWPNSSDELHILTWQPAQGFGRPLASLGWSTFKAGRATVHSRPRIPNVMGRYIKNYKHGLRANERLFRRHTRRLVRTLGIDVLVYGIGRFSLVGWPPFDLPIPRVFDYLDLCSYPEVEAAYVTHSDVVLCTSSVLRDRVQTLGKPAVHIPNGIRMGRITGGHRDATRAELGLEGKQVVSLIGLTSSPSLFFVDALAIAARQIPDLVFLLVGGGTPLQPIVNRCQQLGVPYKATGWVPSSEIGNYFAASDLGLYPGDADPYFDAACPIKVLEYTAARRPVVATDLEELRRMAFTNVRLAPPNPAAFAEAIVSSLRRPSEFADVSGFEWATIAAAARETIAKVVEGAGSR